MATHSSTLAWRIPWREEPGRLQSMVSQRVGHEWATSLTHSVKGFGVVNKAEVDVFLELFCFFYDPMDVGNLILCSSGFSESSLNMWKFTGHILLKPGLENFEHYCASLWDECNCVLVWTFLAFSFLELEWKLTFSRPVATAEFSKFADILSAALQQHYLLGFETAQLEFHLIYLLCS